jgi:hypothetical protein
LRRHPGGTDDGLAIGLPVVGLSWNRRPAPGRCSTTASGTTHHAVEQFGVEAEFLFLAVFFHGDRGVGQGAALVDAENLIAVLIFPAGALGENGDPFLGFGVQQGDAGIVGISPITGEDEIRERVSSGLDWGLGEFKFKGAFSPELLIALHAVFQWSEGFAAGFRRWGRRGVLGGQQGRQGQENEACSEGAGDGAAIQKRLGSFHGR